MLLSLCRVWVAGRVVFGNCVADLLHDGDPWRHVDLSLAAPVGACGVWMDTQQTVQVSVQMHEGDAARKKFARMPCLAATVTTHVARFTAEAFLQSSSPVNSRSAPQHTQKGT